MPSGVVSAVGLGVLDFGGDRRRERGSFGGEFGTSHCNQWAAFVTRFSQITLRTCFSRLAHATLIFRVQ